MSLQGDAEGKEPAKYAKEREMKKRKTIRRVIEQPSRSFDRWTSTVLAVVALTVMLACSGERERGEVLQSEMISARAASVPAPRPESGRVPAGAGVNWGQLLRGAFEAIQDERKNSSPPSLVPSSPTLSVRIEAPVDTISGNWVPITAVTKGEPTAYEWTVIANGTGQQGQPRTPGLVGEGAKVYFTHSVPGDYLVSCGVANAEGQVALASVVVTLLEKPPADPLTLATIARITPQTDLSEQHRAWVAESQPANAAEIRVVAEKFRMVAAMLRGGDVTDGADPLLLVERAVELELAPAGLQRWSSYFGRVRALAGQMQDVGALLGEAEFATLFENLAALLDEAAGRR